MSKKLFYVFLLLFIAAGLLRAEPKATNEITSKLIFAVAAREDTVWALTIKGVNYTTNALSSSVTWHGFYYNKKKQDMPSIGRIAYGAGRAVVPMAANDSRDALNDIMIFTQNSFSRFRFDFEWKQFEDTASSPNFRVNDVVWAEGFFWYACCDAGVVRMGAQDTLIAYPGRDGALSFEEFTKNNFPHVPDSTDSQTVYLSPDTMSNTLWVAQRKAIWCLDTDSLSWQPVVRTSNDTSEIAFIEAGDPNTVFIVLAKKIKSDTSPDYKTYDYDAYKYEKKPQGKWKISLLYEKHSTELIERISPGHVYLSAQNDIVPVAHSDTTNAREVSFAKGGSYKGLQNNMDLSSPEITSIDYTLKSDTGLLWIATTEGMFLSYNAPFRLDSLANLKLFRPESESQKV